MLIEPANTENLLNTNSNKLGNNLLPLMTKTLIILAIFFFVASLVQLFYLQRIILDNPKIDLYNSLSGLTVDSTSTYKDILETTRLKSLILLESGSMQNQYYQANMLLMSRLWVTYIGFVTGMIMAIIGSVFIIGKLRENTTELTAKIQGNDVSLKSASPGIILSFLGTFLMVTALVVHHEINSKYNAIYIHDMQPVTFSPEKEKPPLRPSIADSIINLK